MTDPAVFLGLSEEDVKLLRELPSLEVLQQERPELFSPNEPEVTNEWALFLDLVRGEIIGPGLPEEESEKEESGEDDRDRARLRETVRTAASAFRTWVEIRRGGSP